MDLFKRLTTAITPTHLLGCFTTSFVHLDNVTHTQQEPRSVYLKYHEQVFVDHNFLYFKKSSNTDLLG